MSCELKVVAAACPVQCINLNVRTVIIPHTVVMKRCPHLRPLYFYMLWSV